MNYLSELVLPVHAVPADWVIACPHVISDRFFGQALQIPRGLKWSTNQRSSLLQERSREVKNIASGAIDVFADLPIAQSPRFCSAPSHHSPEERFCMSRSPMSNRFSLIRVLVSAVGVRYVVALHRVCIRTLMSRVRSGLGAGWGSRGRVDAAISRTALEDQNDAVIGTRCRRNG